MGSIFESRSRIRVYGDINSVIRHNRHVQIPHCTFPENPNRNKRRNNRPGDFQWGIVQRFRGSLVARSLAEFHHEVNHRDDDRDEKDDADP